MIQVTEKITSIYHWEEPRQLKTILLKKVSILIEFFVTDWEMLFHNLQNATDEGRSDNRRVEFTIMKRVND